MRTVTRRFALRPADLSGSACPVPAECAAALAARDAVAVTVEHRPGGGALERETFRATPRTGEGEDEGWWLDGVQWPADVRPGVLAAVTWRAGRDEFVVRTAVLDEPMRIDGVDYFHEYDPVAVTREYRPPKSNRGGVLGAVRRLGRVFEDGSAVFPEADLAARAGLGRGTKGAFLLRNAVDQLIREGFVTRVPGSVDAAGRPSYPAVEGEAPADMLFYAPLLEPVPPPDDGAERRDHWVHGFVRKLPPGAQPSPQQLRLHQQAVDNEQIPDGPLAPGYTFVKKHHRHG